MIPIKRSASRKRVLQATRRRSASTRGRAGAAPGFASAAQGPASDVAIDLGPLAIACANLALGYGVTAKHARDAHVADHATILADTYRSLSAHLTGLALSLGNTAPRTKATCGERLRWEWLASSARLLDGVPDERLLAECGRAQEAADAATAALHADAAVKLHPAMRQIHATLVRARNASVRLAQRPVDARTLLGGA